MTFVGNAPCKFQRLTHLAAVDSQQLALILREHDIFVTASLDDPCSNALIEALQCGLIPVVRASGGHLELAGAAGVSFHGTTDILAAIDEAAHFTRDGRMLVPYQHNAPERYLEYMARLYRESAGVRQSRLPLGRWHLGRLRARLLWLRLVARVQRASSKFSHGGS